MAVLRNPLSQMTHEETKAFNGVLERRVVLLTVQELRFRALLESITGEPWDDQYHDLDQAELDSLAEQSLMRSLGISQLEAAKMVRENKDKANARNIA